MPIMMKMSFQDAWIGCDNNDYVRWFHCWCAGFDRKPSSWKNKSAFTATFQNTTAAELG